MQKYKNVLFFTSTECVLAHMSVWQIKPFHLLALVNNMNCLVGWKKNILWKVYLHLKPIRTDIMSVVVIWKNSIWHGQLEETNNIHFILIIQAWIPSLTRKLDYYKKSACSVWKWLWLGEDIDFCILVEVCGTLTNCFPYLKRQTGLFLRR